MKKILMIVLSFLLIVTVGCTSQNNNEADIKNIEETVESNEDQQVETVQEQVVIEDVSIMFNQDLGDMNIENLLNNYMYSSDMAAYMSEAVLQDMFEKMNLGKVIERLQADVSVQNGFDVVSTPTVFENNQLTVNLVFNDKQEIAGFNFGVFENDGDVVSELSIEEIAINHLHAFNEGDYEKLITDFVYTEQMLTFANEDTYRETREGINTGDLLEIKQVFEYEMQGYVIVNIPVVFENIKFNYNLVFDGKKMIAGSNIGEYEERLTVDMPENILETKMVSDVNGLSLDGILTTPNNSEAYPLVILVHGSGASDKDETVYGNKPFRDIAWGLAQRGIASYRYDKGVFSDPDKFVANVHATLYEETIDDAVAIAQNMENLDKVSGVYILGHSLGGYAMPLISKEYDGAGYIIMAANSRPIDVLLEEQIQYIAEIDNVVTEDEKSSNEAIMASIEKIRALDFASDEERILGGTKAYWKFLNEYEPLEVAKDMDKPVLVLQGQRDYQVTMVDYMRWYDAFSKEENWSFKTYEKLTHLMMPGEGKPTNTEYTLANTVDEQVIIDIAAWILEEK